MSLNFLNSELSAEFYEFFQALCSVYVNAELGILDHQNGNFPFLDFVILKS